jgi:hypothetical protein
MDTADYTIVSTNDINEIKKDDYILHNDEICKIVCYKYRVNKNVYHSVIYKCEKYLKAYM